MASNNPNPSRSDAAERDSTEKATVTKLKTHACKWCPAKFAHKCFLERHLRVHTFERPFQCGHCGRRFSHASNLRTHMKTHLKEKPFLCRVCPKRFAVKQYLKLHELTHVNKPFICTNCGKSFIGKGDLARHKPCEEKIFTCDLCSQTYTDPSGLHRHMKKQHGDQDQGVKTLFKCECGISFARKWQLKAHKTHPAGDKAFKCDFCPLSYAYPSNLLHHMKEHHNLQDLEHTQEEKMPFKCAQCGESFARRWQLITHKPKHEREKALCPRIYAYSRGLCEENKADNNSQDNEITHEEEHSFKCTKCKKSFAREWELIAHKGQHEGEKRFKCDLCPCAYAYSCSLSRNKKVIRY